MEESSQQSMMDAESQQTLVESQMSMEQDLSESQSQMEMSQQFQEEVSKPECNTDDFKSECDATIPKQPKLHHGDDPDDTAPPAVTTQQTAEPDKGMCENGDGRGPEESKKEEEKLIDKKADKDNVGKDEEDSLAFPDTLEGFKYAFNEHGQLRHTETGEPFVFEVRKGDMRYNQRHYEALGEVITQHVYNLLESETNLKKVYLCDSEDEPRGFVFMSENALTTTDKLLVMIHGSGVVRAGQWARRLIINDCLDSGTQLLYIKRAMEEGYEVLVMNTNENFATLENGRRVSIKGSSSPREHGLNVWDKFVDETPAKHVAIVAHSFGGVVTINLAVHRTESFRKKVFAMALTDSVHSLHYDIDTNLHMWFVKNAVNWVSSREELGTLISDAGYDCPRVSAGTSRHEETSWYSFDCIFKFLRSKENELKSAKSEDHVDSEVSEATGDAKGTEDDRGKEDGGGKEEVLTDDMLGPQGAEAQGVEAQSMQPPESDGQETEIGGRETEL